MEQRSSAKKRQRCERKREEEEEEEEERQSEEAEKGLSAPPGRGNARYLDSSKILCISCYWV